MSLSRTGAAFGLVLCEPFPMESSPPGLESYDSLAFRSLHRRKCDAENAVTFCIAKGSDGIQIFLFFFLFSLVTAGIGRCGMRHECGFWTGSLRGEDDTKSCHDLCFFVSLSIKIGDLWKDFSYT